LFILDEMSHLSDKTKLKGGIRFEPISNSNNKPKEQLTLLNNDSNGNKSLHAHRPDYNNKYDEIHNEEPCLADIHRSLKKIENIVIFM